MDARDAQQLLTPHGLRLLDDVTALPSGLDIVAQVAQLRKDGNDPALVAAAVSQARLRHKARSKFGEFADTMLFTPAGLEQATRFTVAAHHAGRYSRAGFRRVADLGCGIGGDALALASLGIRVLAVDSDEVTAAFASYNLAPFPDCEVRHEAADSVDLSEMDALWFDPARRTAGHASSTRLADPGDWSPALDWVFARAAEKPSGIKLGPGFPLESIPPELGGQPVEAQWIDVKGETVELVLWTGALARDGVGRSALVLARDGEPSGYHEMTGTGESSDAHVGELGAFVYEPHGAVIRARLIGDLARFLGAHALDEHIAYLSADAHTPTPFADAFRVLEVLPLDSKKISRALAERQIGTLEIKKRGVDIDPATFRTKLRLNGPESATLLLMRLGSGASSRRIAVVAKRT
ncbi:MAG: SAM-dependent methyltransferase [Microbacteriaceae bacterium]|nr:SAM-dependent methyltransferase [Microbacteriaceae bacterium]